MKHKFRVYLAFVIGTLIVGGLSAWLTGDIGNKYQSLIQPPLAPPEWVFPVVWTILFILMGISAAIIYQSDSNRKSSALALYFVQLGVNFFWSILFFRFDLYLFAFIWLLLLIALVALMYIDFRKISHKAAYLLIPYLIWLIFAGYLNFTIYLLNG